MPRKLVLEKINSLKVVTQINFSVSFFLALKLSKFCILENTCDFWRVLIFSDFTKTFFLVHKLKTSHDTILRPELKISGAVYVSALINLRYNFRTLFTRILWGIASVYQN